MKASIIGAGRLGTCLGRALAAHGIAIQAVCDRTAGRAALGRRYLGAGLATTDHALAASLAEVVFLCLPDDAIAGEARNLAGAGLRWRRKTVFHCSGLLAADKLSPLRRRGAAVASFHPVQSFPRKGMPPSVFRGITVGLEGERSARLLGRKIALRLGAQPMTVRASDKSLYHAACSLASNHALVLFRMAARLLSDTGMSLRKAEQVLLPLAQGTLQNVKELGSAAALTGPLVRGDAATVARHLQALKKRSGLLRAYRTLAIEGLAMARRSGLPPPSITALSRLLKTPRKKTTKIGGAR